ncbi:hypothetical protein [uncultured Psychrosphaera sp.]|jgi:hypothetical protein|uniref:hypothetical protein n=1 Tax=uncultured Psychrosphaera sp. TaxID=1403522 RepID=UPI0026165FCD|nr:hypothetical protein [uncultured Psychrosphaera sp.]
MNNASLGDYANFISAFAAALSLLAPVIYTWVSQRARFGKAENYVESLKLLTELKSLLNKHTSKEDPLVYKKLKTMIAELKLDIKKQSNARISLRPFYIVLFFEILIFMVVWLSGSSQWLTTFFEAKSKDSGIGFFEGVLQAPEMRLLIIMINLLSAAFINRYVIRRLQTKLKTAVLLNSASIGMFHVVMFSVLLFTYVLLSTLDNYFSVF